MLRHVVSRTLIATLVIGTLVACDSAPTAPPVLDGIDAFDGSTADGRTARGGTNTAGRPTGGTSAGRPTLDSVRVCRPDETPALTPEQVAQIRALWAAYHDAVAPLLRYIEQVEQEAREAAAAGASRERVEAILAKADEAKREVARLTARLRDAINDILSEGQRRHCVIAVPLGSQG